MIEQPFFGLQEKLFKKLEESSNNSLRSNGAFHFISFGDLKSFIMELRAIL